MSNKQTPAPWWLTILMLVVLPALSFAALCLVIYLVRIGCF